MNDELDKARRVADALWVASCFHAAEGVETDSAQLQAKLGEATRQRDELLAALEALVTIVADTRHPDPDDVYAVIAEARDTINQVRNEI